MKGFAPKFKDFPDYILGITKEIWEGRRIAAIKDYYSPDIVVRSPASVVVGNEDVVGATMETLAEFPDRQLYGEDVIWCGTPEKGMLSSHRIHSTATHSHSGVYGKATGRKLRYRIIADCHAIENQVDDEWLIRDQGAIVRQLGWNPKNYAAHLITCEGGPECAARPFTPANDRPGPYQGKGNDSEWGARLGDIITRIMAADMAAIPEAYDRACQLDYAGGIQGLSTGDADEFWMGLRASFPKARFAIEHQMGREDPLMPPRAAVRWSLDGRHDGWGFFGKPTGAEVHVMGATHAEFGPWGIRREVTLYDETAVWKQILLQAG